MYFFLFFIFFFFDATGLKESVEGTLARNSLTTVLNEVHFLVSLYSFPLPLVSQANPSFTKVSHLPPPRQNNFQNFHGPIFLY